MRSETTSMKTTLIFSVLAALASATTSIPASPSATITGPPASLTVGASIPTFTYTLFGSTITGSATVIPCATVIINAVSIYILEDNSDFVGDADLDFTFNGITVNHGTPTPPAACWTPPSITSTSSSTTTASSGSSTRSSATTTATPNAARPAQMDSAQLFSWAGVALGAVAMANA
ncbi:uncharacterized protein B0I36DRAFT_331601 [Microdochium trichocladiopsis]|uniref:GPI anchored protein n=1 Tax=Microdochium trichocladiopsis TaxID=1682393 RepID=A0A9P8XYR0_9PEZI|nr:uncharacterized protein B0I36DRAFT_331601 [Microdochium trichocladiopsis]KAH7024540.1 hypothetical protein B0I36DRAFT_331601 [Microdochium trichocladiopsis]